MQFFLISVFVSTGLAYIAQKQKEAGKNNKWIVLLLIIFLVFLSGFRYMNYNQSDEWAYRHTCESYKGTVFDLGQHQEWIFYLLSWLCGNTFMGGYLLIFVTALITNISLVMFFEKYSYSFCLTMFLYIGTGFFIASMNVIRQYLALAVIIWCYPLAIKSKFLKYALLVAIGGLIHTSAWFLLPLYFLFREKRSKGLTFAVIALFLFMFVRFEDIMEFILPYTSYDNYLDDILTVNRGIKIIRALAWVVPLFLILIFRKLLIDKYHVNIAYIYSAIFSLGISILATRYVYVSRFDAYFLIPTLTVFGLIPKAFPKGFKEIVMWGMVILFFGFGMYQATITPQYHNIIFEGLKPF